MSAPLLDTNQPATLEMQIFLNIESALGARAGIGNYTHQLYRGLFTRLPTEQLKFFPVSEITNDFHQAQLLQTKNRFSTSLKLGLRGLPFAYPTRQLIREVMFKRFVNRVGKAPKIYHEPNFILMPFDGPTVTTIHDLSWIHYPEFHPKERVKWLEKNIDKTIRDASRFIAISEFVREELTRILHIDPKLIRTIPNGVDPEFHPRSQESIANHLKKFGLKHRSYLLSVSTFEPRKNFHRLLDAYSLLPLSLQRRFPLVHIGGTGWCTDEIEKKAVELERRGLFIRLGYIPDAELPFLYNGAYAFLYPSLYEGFGLPILEAIASGIPVLTSKNSAMEEVAGGVALLCNALDVEEIAEKIKLLVNDSHLHYELSEKGLSRARDFSWSKTVDDTFELYAELATQ